MINIFNKEKAKEFTRNLNKEINKLSGYRLKLYEPDEDPDGNFHALCSDVLKIGSQNNKCREKFAGILLSKSFQDLLYHKVGDHLGYSKDEIKKKSIRKKISDAVIASTFQDLRRRRDIPRPIRPFPDSYSTDKRFPPINRQRDWRYGDYNHNVLFLTTLLSIRISFTNKLCLKLTVSQKFTSNFFRLQISSDCRYSIFI